MPRQNLIACALLVAAIGSSPLFASGLGAAQATAVTAAAQTSNQGGVKITVEPLGFPRDGTWDFAITLETHTRPLDDDLVRTSTLIVDGKPYRPLGWEGAPPGGHHRKGVLRFDAVTPLPQVVELQIHRTGEASPRIYRWQPGPRP